MEWNHELGIDTRRTFHTNEEKRPNGYSDGSGDYARRPRLRTASLIRD